MSAGESSGSLQVRRRRAADAAAQRDLAASDGEASGGAARSLRSMRKDSVEEGYPRIAARSLDLPGAGR